MGNAAAARAGGRLAHVDSLRAIAALSVVAFHVTYRFPRPPNALWANLSQRAAGPPVPGVVLFFLISGFVLYRPFVRARFEGRPLPELGAYATRRVARIVPAYWVALAVATVWIGLPEVESARGVIRYFGFLQLYGPMSVASGGISPAWTLCVEVTFYAVLPLLAIGARRLLPARPLRSELTLCALLVVASLAWQLAVGLAVPDGSAWKVDLLWTLPGSLDCFALGMLFAVLGAVPAAQPLRGLAAVERAPWLLWAVALGLLYLVGRLAPLGRHGLIAWWIPTHELKAVACALLLAPAGLFPERRDWTRRLLAWRPLVWVGTVSYGIYLWHMPLLTKIAPLVVPDGQLVAQLVTIALSVFLGAASFYLVEQPAQRLARRLPRRRTSPPAPAAERAVLDPVVAVTTQDPSL